MSSDPASRFILGTKEGMSQIFQEDGRVMPVSVIKAEPLTLVQIKSLEKDGYQAVKVGAGHSRKKGKAHQGQARGLGQFSFFKEFRGLTKEAAVGQKIDLSVFKKGDKVKVSGLAKGKGFQGVVKRHGFHGMPASHGHKHVTRHGGSIGQRFPQHTLKGTRMAGRMGGKRISVRGLTVVEVDAKSNFLVLKGAVPGRKGSWLEIVALNH